MTRSFPTNSSQNSRASGNQRRLGRVQKVAGGGDGSEMSAEKQFPPGILVHVVKGAFTSCVGVVLDPSKAVDVRGEPFPAVACGFHWVMLTLNGALFPAHLREDEIEPMPVS